MDNKKKFYAKRILSVNLSFNDGYREEPIYTIKGNTSEKEKGFNMINLIRDNFNLTEAMMDYYTKKIREEITAEMNGYEYKTHGFTRDENGSIISPFASKPGSLRDKPFSGFKDTFKK